MRDQALGVRDQVYTPRRARPAECDAKRVRACVSWSRTSTRVHPKHRCTRRRAPPAVVTRDQQLVRVHRSIHRRARPALVTRDHHLVRVHRCTHVDVRERVACGGQRTRY
jgi:hypothetical protein